MAAKKAASRKKGNAAAAGDGADDPFHALARRRAAREVLVPPAMLPQEERRLHIRRTLREDHQFRIANRPEGAQAKFDKLAASPFQFFRGTALLYFRDQAGTDAELPIVLAVGDVHPENFGVMPNENGAPFFGINDFDEAHFAPFSWDVKRGAVGFRLATRENGLSKKQRRKIVRSWVNGYWQGLQEFARNSRESQHQFRIDNSPPMIRELLESAQRDRRDFLAKMIDLERERFLITEEIVPHSAHLNEFQRAIDEYCEQNRIEVPRHEGCFRVRDVAIKKGSGTASLGLDRFLVLIAGPSDDSGDDVVLELKQARPSVLTGLAPADRRPRGSEARRIVSAHDVHLAGGDPYYGVTTVEGRSFLVRERSPFKKSIDLDELDFEGTREYARICGYVLSQAHARTDDEAGQRILAAVDPDVFADDVVRFARRSVKRVVRDYRLFKKDHALGAFRFAPSL